MPNKRSKLKNSKLSTYELIIKETEEIISKRGIDALLLNDIAEKLGIRRPSIYTHFDGREGILAAVAKRVINALSEQFKADEGLPVEDQIAEGVKGLVDVMIQNPAYSRLLFRDFSIPGGLNAFNIVMGFPEESKHPKITRGLYKRIQTIIDKGVNENIFIKIDSELYFNLILCSIMLIQTYPTRKLTKNIEQ